MTTKKMTVLIRVEPGCLGPTGADYVEEFCAFAHPVFNRMKSAFLQWELIPRYDKSLDEIEYQLCGRTLANDKAEKYLALFHSTCQDLEEDISAKLSISIDKFFERS